MAITKQRTTPPDGLVTQVASGLIVADAVAAITTTVTAAANQYSQLTADSLTGFSTTDVIQITGAGPSGAKQYYKISSIGTGGGVSTTKFDIPQLKPISTAVSGALMELYYRVYTTFFPDKVQLIDITNGIKWEWIRGMLPNTAIKTDASGVTTVLQDSGFVVGARGFHFHPQMAPPNSRVIYNVTYPMQS